MQMQFFLKPLLVLLYRFIVRGATPIAHQADSNRSKRADPGYTDSGYVHSLNFFSSVAYMCLIKSE
jgi:hypothetical protein